MMGEQTAENQSAARERRIAEIRERRAKITPPPWGPHEMPALSGGAHEWFEVGPYPDHPVCEVTNDYENFRANAEFIAKAPEDIDCLLSLLQLKRNEPSTVTTSEVATRDLDWALRELADGWIDSSQREGPYGFYQNARRVLEAIADDARANAIREAVREVTRELTYSDDVINDERVPFDDLSMCRRAVFALQSLLDKKEGEDGPTTTVADVD